MRRRGRALLLAAAAALAALAVWLAAPVMAPGSMPGGPTGPDGAEGGPSAWDPGPGVAAWLSVDGTPVDLAVARGPEEDPDRYLTRALDGSYSPVGTPYIDARCPEDGPHTIVFAHNEGLGSRAFTPLARAYRDGADVGVARWTVPGRETVELDPVMAMEVDAGFAGVQEFDLAGAGDLRGWLLGLSGSADVLMPGWEGTVSSATRALTLVTCSTADAGCPTRVVYVFAR